MQQFKDQLVIVTGGTRGIGKAISSAFLDQGAHVIATYVSGEEAAQKFKSEHPNGENLELRKFDVSKADQVESFFGELEPTPHILINNAAILVPRVPVEERTEEEWDRVMAVNAKGVFLGTKTAIPAMRNAGGGLIVNISSMRGLDKH